MKKTISFLVGLFLVCQSFGWVQGSSDIKPNTPPPPPQSINTPPPPPPRSVYDNMGLYLEGTSRAIYDEAKARSLKAQQTAQQPAPQTAQQPAPQTAQQPAPQTAQQPAPQTAQQPAPQTAQQPAPQTTPPAPQTAQTDQDLSGYAPPYTTSKSIKAKEFYFNINPILKDGITPNEVIKYLGEPFLTWGNKDDSFWLYPNTTLISNYHALIAQSKYKHVFKNESISNYKYDVPEYFSWNDKPYCLIFEFNKSTDKFNTSTAYSGGVYFDDEVANLKSLPFPWLAPK
jgi:hypothetical protein